MEEEEVGLPGVACLHLAPAASRPVATVLDNHTFISLARIRSTRYMPGIVLSALYTGSHLNFTATVWSVDTAIFIPI